MLKSTQSSQNIRKTKILIESQEMENFGKQVKFTAKLNFLKADHNIFFCGLPKKQ